MTDAHPARRRDRAEQDVAEPAADKSPAGDTSAPAEVGAEPPQVDTLYTEGLQVKPQTQWSLARRRFFRHRLAVGSLVLLVVIFGAGVFAETVAPYSFEEQNFPDSALGPTLENKHFFGTDVLGRDYFSRVVFGIKTSEQVALTVALLSTIIGVLVGAAAGYFGGWIDNLLMRLTDLFLTLPLIAVLLVFSALVGQGKPLRVAIILAFFFWTTLARIVRGQFLSLREKEYIEAAKAAGSSDSRIIFRHMLPNTVGPIIVNATFTIALAIAVEAAISFLGFGVKPPTPALGKLISDAEGEMLTGHWWLGVFPGLMIALIILCVNFVGDGLRDALDPTQRRIRA